MCYIKIYVNVQTPFICVYTSRDVNDSLYRARYFPINVPKSMNPGEASWKVNKTLHNSQRFPNGSVMRIEEKCEEEMERLILQTTDEGDLVFDPFCGTGTTGIACAKHGRRFIGYFAFI